MSNFYVTHPIDLTASGVLTYSSVSDPDAGETPWASGGTYSRGDVRTYSGYKYTAYGAITGRTVTPDSDSYYWNKGAPVNRMAMFDSSATTATTATGSLTVRIRPGNFDSVHFYGLQAAGVTMTLRNYSTNVVYWTKKFDMIRLALSWWDFFFGAYPSYKNQLQYSFIPSANMELEVVFTGGQISVGNMIVGSRIDFAQTWGGAQFGATITQRDNRVYVADDFGNSRPVGLLKGVDLDVRVMMSNNDAAQAFDAILAALGKPCAWAIDDDIYGFVDVFGTGTAPISLNCNHSIMDIKVKGFQ